MIEKGTESPVFTACRFQRLDDLDRLLDAGHDPDGGVQTGTPLLECVRYSRWHEAHRLISAGATGKDDAVIRFLVTHSAPSFANLEEFEANRLIEHMVERGVSLTKANHDGQPESLLYLACRNDCPMIVDTLLDHGLSPIEHRNGTTIAPLDVAITTMAWDALDSLLRHEATSQDCLDHYLLNYLNLSGLAPKPLRMLLEAGADPLEATASGETSIDIAMRRGWHDGARMMEEAVADREAAVLNSQAPTASRSTSGPTSTL